MPLKELVAQVVETTEGSLGAVVMDSDGIVVDSYVKDSSFDLQTLAVEYVSVLREIRKSVSVLNLGDTEEVAVHTGSVRIVLRMISDDLFILLALGGDGNFGRGRYILRRDLPLFREKLL